MIHLAALVVLVILTVVPVGPARAEPPTVETNERVLISFGVLACNGESVQLTGMAHSLYRVTLDRTDGNHMQYHYNYQLSGTGQDSGARYTFNVSGSEHINELGPLPVTLTFPYHANLVGAGAVADGKIHAATRLIIDANGTVHSDVHEVKQACT